MASVFVLLEAFTRKEAAALGFFPCATASQNRLWIFSGKWDKYGTFCPKMACFLHFHIVATTQNQSIGFIVGITTMNTCKSLFLDITIRRKGCLLLSNLHLFISLYPDCIVWRMKWRKWRMAYLAYTLLYSSGTFHCANWRSRFSNSDFRSSLVTSA